MGRCGRRRGWLLRPHYIGWRGCLGFSRGLLIVGRTAAIVRASRPFDSDRAVLGGFVAPAFSRLRGAYVRLWPWRRGGHYPVCLKLNRVLI